MIFILCNPEFLDSLQHNGGIPIFLHLKTNDNITIRSANRAMYKKFV